MITRRQILARALALPVATQVVPTMIAGFDPAFSPDRTVWAFCTIGMDGKFSHRCITDKDFWAHATKSGWDGYTHRKLKEGEA